MAEHSIGLLFLPDARALPGISAENVAWLAGRFPGIEWRLAESEDDFLRQLPEADLASVFRFKKEWLDSAPKLRLLSTPAAGKDWVEVRSKPGLEVAFGAFHGENMAETAVGLILAFSRGIKASLDRQSAEPWARGAVSRTMRPLRGSTAVIVGFGNIGKWVGVLLKPFGVRVIGVNRSNVHRPEWFGKEDAVVPLSRLDAVLPEADHVVMVLPGEASSEKVLDERRLALLPGTAFVYNIGRGNAIDERALVRALHEGRVAGAGLDVFEQEPLPADSPIRSCPNVILMPHVSAFGPNYLELYFREFAQTVERLFPGSPGK
jgi:Phosphoglycerate dehydrogenase and related dehydrogenases